MPLTSRSNPPEILAPAGGRAQFFAALNAGADAVYLGLKAFNARARAENFSPDDLKELVPLAHKYGMKVLVTFNILIKEHELSSAAQTLATLEELEVDAIIVQDLAVAKIARTHFPGIRLHASTQMAVHNLAGVRKAAKLGFRRVVLAREMTATELKRIRDEIPRSEVEIEAFCHGSLCYSYSGLCFFSGAEDARSGNRGECAYTCRQPYKILSEPGQGFLFSMRDLDTSSHLDQLVVSGIDTLKIEGRKKDAQYVTSTVALYRRKLDELFGQSTLRESAPQSAFQYGEDHGSRAEGDLALSFQRRPTALFLKGRYHEDVIDLDNPTHTGLPVGIISQVKDDSVFITTACDLERFDGVRIVSSERIFHSLPQHGSKVAQDTQGLVERYENQNLEFSLRELRVDRQRVFTAAKGSKVEISLPSGAKARVGDTIYKVRSADLKRRVDALANRPMGDKAHALTLIDVDIDAKAAGDLVLLTATAKKWANVIATAEISLPFAISKKASTLEADVQAAFAILGDAGFQAKSVLFSGSPGLFVPRAKIKALKAELGRKLESAYPEFQMARVTKALQDCLPHSSPAGLASENPSHSTCYPEGITDPRLAIKSDRIETLKSASVFARTHLGGQLGELVFEPKRAFLQNLSGEHLAGELTNLEKESGLPVRLALPTVIRAWDEPLLKRWCTKAAEAGIWRFEVGNLGAIELLKSWDLASRAQRKLDLAGDFTLYALNSAATRFWQSEGLSRICLSVEDDSDNLGQHLMNLSADERPAMQAIVYKDTPLFLAEACSLTALHGGCPTSAVCGYRTLTVENMRGERFHVAHESCKSVVYGDEAYSTLHKISDLKKMGIGWIRVDFLTRAYAGPEVEAVLEGLVKGQRLKGTHVANFERKLL